MIAAIIRFSVQQKLITGIFTVGLLAIGLYSLQKLSIDAVPDITNNQVQVVTISGSLAPQEVEQFITYPVEVAVANIPNVEEIRSISRFGLSVVTIVFKDRVPNLEARQYVKEQIDLAKQEIPAALGSPELMPITTGLGEIYQYVLEIAPGYEDQYDPMELRTIQDWIVKRQLAGIPGIIEISSFGGYLKQYEVAIDPLLLRSQDISLFEVYDALAKNNQNTGGSYIEKAQNAYYIRTEGLIQSLEDIQQIVVSKNHGAPVLIGDIAEVRFGHPKRFGAMTMDGKGEAVGGITLMLKGANSLEAIQNVKERIATVQNSLPEGVHLYPYLDRSELIAKTSATVRSNLVEGGAIVILVLILLLGNWRAGLIVASVIPLAMLFAIIMMRLLGVSANLMSLGAIDFGIVVDGAVIIVEGILFMLGVNYAGRQLSQAEMNEVVINESAKLFKAAVFGVFIILVVFIPIITLSGIEGKMFQPMALTFSFAVLGALLLSLTYVPMLSSIFLQKKISTHQSYADRLIDWLKSIYRPSLSAMLKNPVLIIVVSLVLLGASIGVFTRLGAEFIPTLEEGDLAMQMAIPPGSSLQESVKASSKAERILLDQFPEVEHVVSKIGTAEVPTDPMAIEDADIMIILKDKEEWTSAKTREGLVEKMKSSLDVVLGASFEFTQPIQLRFNELMSGSKADISVKIFGENTEVLAQLGNRASQLIDDIPGAADVKLEQTEGLPQLKIRFKRDKIAEYGLDIEQLNRIVKTAFAGETAGVVYEDERKFDLVVRLQEEQRQALVLADLFVPIDEHHSIPMNELAEVQYTEGPMQIAREDARRRISIGINVRDRDIASLVAAIQTTLDQELSIPPGYYIQYGGQFENLQKAQDRLFIAVPIALLLILILLFFTFGSIQQALIIFSAVPLSAIGGIAALWLRGMPFSISAGVGFIALFGVSVLNGIVLISYFNRIQKEQGINDLKTIIMEGSMARLRPVLMTAIVAALGFLPMALSTSNGAEVQKPLATVVIGGLFTATLLTLLVLPTLYYLLNRRRKVGKFLTISALLLMGMNAPLAAQEISLQNAIDSALLQHPKLRIANLQMRIAEQGLEQARQIPATSFNLTVGQLDSRGTDFNFSASQSLGNIAADKQRRKVASADIALATQTNNLVEYQIIYEVQKAWYDWNFEVQKLNKLDSLQQLYQAWNEKSQLQLEQGVINRLEQKLLANRLLQLQQTITAAQQSALQAKTQLMKAAWIRETNINPNLSQEPTPVAISKQINPVLTSVLSQEINKAREERILSEKAFAPRWSFNAFHQSLSPLYPLFGVGVGAQIPLFRKAGNAQIRSYQLQQQVISNELLNLQEQLQMEQQEKELTLSNYAQQLNTTGNELLTQAKELRGLAQQQLQAGQSNYFQFLQAVDMAFQNEMEYLDLLNKYTRAVLDYNFLVE